LATERLCDLETCVEPEQIGCNRGFEFLENCQHWKGAHQRKVAADVHGGGDAELVQPDSTIEAPEGDRQLHLPWTGNSLGTLDLELATACNRTEVIGVVGPFNSGKTTLLTIIYLLIHHGEQSAAGKFAGSWSLIGWNNLAAKFRWKPGNGGPGFPPHTSRGAGRRPGLLHLALRDRQSIRQDYLVTDPPGEWFSLWAQKEAAEGAAGARWVQQYADRFLFLVDREALASKERGKERDMLKDLARRLSGGLRDRPIAVVWTKSDIKILSTIEQDLRDCFAVEFPNHSEFRVRMRFGNETREEVEEPCLRLMEWMFGPKSKSERGAPIVLAKDSSDLFLAYRGQGEQGEQ
jgi:hypothetical protein